jgi:CheY-like chemotaxis protein
MDLQMPVLDGFQATTDIRRVETQRVAASVSHERFNVRLKVYALSGLASQEDKERASLLGFDG